MTSTSTPLQPTPDALITFVLEKDLHAYLSVDDVVVWAGVALFAIVTTFLTLRFLNALPSVRTRLELDQAQFGFGNQKLILKPNETDRQLAYRIWVELSTRKLGLRVNLEDDVISEVYDSWYNFFSVTRNLIKDVPVSKFRRKDTEQIIQLSVEVLNSGLRPHLTRWQARFRRWYEKALEQETRAGVAPQDVQKDFPDYDQLRADLERVNERLILYRDKMYELIAGR